MTKDENFVVKLRAGTATDGDFKREANRLRWERLQEAIARLARPSDLAA